MALLGAAAMVAMYDLEDGWEERHDDWHSHEHMLERVSIPGFRRGRRYAAEASPRRLVLYEVSDLAVLTSEAYLARLNDPTRWSSELMPHFRNMSRTLCRVTINRGSAVGGHMTYLALSPRPDRAEDLRAWLAAELDALVARPGFLGGYLLEGDPDASRIRTREKELRGGDDTVADWLLLVDGYATPDPAFASGPLTEANLVANGAGAVGTPIRCQLAALLAETET